MRLGFRLKMEDALFEKSRIEKGMYWDKAWTLVSGCTPCSPGCGDETGGGCWALGMEKRFGRSGPVTVHPERLDIPLRRKKPTVWAIWNDFGHEDVPQNFIYDVMDTVSHCPQHIFLALTKRPQNIYYKQFENFPNFWLGVTVCNQEEADEKIPLLLQIPAAVRWVSIEPMLGPVDLFDAFGGYDQSLGMSESVDWIVLGGESGPGARPMHPDWVRSVRDQCQAAGVPFFFKQWGAGSFEMCPDYHKGRDWPDWKKKLHGRSLDGREWNELPEIK